MKCNLHSENEMDILELGGEIDLQYSPGLRQRILASVKNKKPLLIDLGQVSYIDSSGIASLVEGLQAARNAELPYGLTQVSDPVSQVLSLTRLDNIFPRYDSPEEFRSQVQD